MWCRFYLVIVGCIATLANRAQSIPGGAVLWLDAARGVEINQSLVTGWKDFSGQAHHAVTRTWKGPTPGLDSQRRIPFVHFDGFDNGMETPAMVSFPKKRGTLSVVARVRGRSKTSGVGMGNFLATYHGKGHVWQWGVMDSKVMFYDGISNSGPVLEELDFMRWVIVTIRRTGDQEMELFVNGRLQTTFSILPDQPDTNTIKIGYNGRLGGLNGDSIPEVFYGDLAEVLVYPRTLSDAELNTLHHTLSKKYAITLLPAPFTETIWFYAILLALLLVLLYGVYLVQMQRKLRERLRALEKQRAIDAERVRISREMHDDIGAGLTRIVMMSESAKHQATESSVTTLDEIAQASRKLVGSMSAIIWSMHQESRSLQELFVFARDQLHQQLEYSMLHYELFFPDNAVDVRWSADQQRHFLLLLRESVNNVLKHSKATQVKISVQFVNDGLVLRVEDNGRGFHMNDTSHGNGLRIMEHRSKALGGSIHVVSAPNEGTCVELVIPL